jgi:hypothetical protein
VQPCDADDDNGALRNGNFNRGVLSIYRRGSEDDVVGRIPRKSQKLQDKKTGELIERRGSKDYRWKHPKGLMCDGKAVVPFQNLCIGLQEVKMSIQDVFDTGTNRCFSFWYYTAQQLKCFLLDILMHRE